MWCTRVVTLVAAVAAATIALPPPASPAPDGGAVRPVPALRETALAVRTNDGLVLPAVLRVPVGDGPARPGLVLVHGAGQGAGAAYRAEAEAFGRAGIATLTYDRRTVGYSLTERSYSGLADDAVAATRLLRRQPGVDPAAVGLWGLSEGGWVAPLAASRAPETAFLVVVGANGLPPLRQQVWSEKVTMRAAGVRGSLVDAASSGTYRLIASADGFPEAHHDPVPVLRRLTLPVLAVWGALDRSTPPVENVSVFRAALSGGGNPPHALHTIAGAEHSLRTSTTGFDRGTDFAPGYVDLVTSWVHAVHEGAPPLSSVVGAGDQPWPTVDVAPSAWYESAAAHGGALAVMLGCLVAAGVAAIAARRAHGIDAAALMVAGSGLVTVVGTLLYLGALTVARGGGPIDPGPLLAGRPLPWLALQALALVTVGGGVALLARRVLRRQAGDRAPVPLLVGVGVLVPWSLYWGLLLP